MDMLGKPKTPPPSTRSSRGSSCTLHKEIPAYGSDEEQAFASSTSASSQCGVVRSDSKRVIKHTSEDQQSPKGVLENGFRWLSESSSSNASISPYSSSTPAPSQWRKLFRLWSPKSIRRTSTFPAAGTPKLRKSGKDAHVAQYDDNNVDPDSSLFKPSCRSFSISELKAATNNFNPDNVIGKGGFATVYKGCLEDGQLVAIKRLTHGRVEEQTSNFLSELGVVVHVNHPNTAKLIGFCIDEGMHLVLQLSPHGSLASLLHDSKGKLEWGIRYKIAIGIAQGLEYLHEKCPRRIIHRDIKAANILLTENFEAQICDFGLAKWLPDQWSHHKVSSNEGTFGYLAPECVVHGVVDEKTDIFAFGVVLLELITGRRAIDSSTRSLVMWAKPVLATNDIKKLVDSSLGDTYECSQLNGMLSAASQCLQNSALLRPKMSQILKILRDEDNSSRLMEPLDKKIFQRTFSKEIFDVEEYNATKYLNDLERHKKLALDL